ncbi:MAG: UDP-N-acetylglucosamine 2-epimerase [Bacteroidales bacterium]|jgi:UDP-N-acetylglucosamine 2-epimerase (hydrolysing)|nr:UDP-N-acetylglucosamine 2-epimerase [Bacteroidales bacterium]
MNVKRILYLTGTRADFGKLKPLMLKLEQDPAFDVHVFVTGMHMLSKYGYTVDEVRKCGFRNIYNFINHTGTAPMDTILANTIFGISNYLSEYSIDMIIVHGDRVEPLAGAIAGSLNNILVCHIEGGEVSGTIDELLRHAISKLSHIHMVANEKARRRLIQMGEDPFRIFLIGSPDIDIMLSDELPSLDAVKKHYEIPYDEYALFIYHPVTTEMKTLRDGFREVLAALAASGRKYVAVYPNNDPGNEILMEEMETLRGNPDFMIFPSIRFENFLVLMKNCEFIIGNSSAGVREAEIYHRTAINIGTRQQNRHHSANIINVPEDRDKILEAIRAVPGRQNSNSYSFGDGRSADRFHEIINNPGTWKIPCQKNFIDIDF